MQLTDCNADTKYIHRLPKIFAQTEEWLVHGNIGIAIGAVGWTLSFYQIKGLSPDPLVLGLSFALASILYNYDYLSQHQALDDCLNHRERSVWIEQNLGRLKIFVWTAVISLVPLLAIHPVALLLIVPSLFFTLCYAKPILPNGLAPKQLPGVKAFYAAFFWVVLVVGIPGIVAAVTWDRQSLSAAAIIFCFIVSIANLWDIRDVEGDKLVNTLTLPVLLGKRFGLIFSLVCAAIGGLLAISSGSLGYGIFALYLGTAIAANRYWFKFSRFCPFGIVA